VPSTIHHVIEFPSPPSTIYDCLMNPSIFASVTAAPAEIEPTPGGAFSLFGERVEGRNVELVKASRIVQAWRVTAWEPGVYSIVRFELGAVGDSTQVTFDHTGFPEDNYADLDAGWSAMYWDPIKKHIG
jgi:activator of HSP90 ATPase